MYKNPQAEGLRVFVTVQYDNLSKFFKIDEMQGEKVWETFARP